MTFYPKDRYHLKRIFPRIYKGDIRLLWIYVFFFIILYNHIQITYREWCRLIRSYARLFLFLFCMSLFRSFSITIGFLFSCITRLLTFFSITVFLSVTFPYYKFSTVAAANHADLRIVIIQIFPR